MSRTKFSIVIDTRTPKKSGKYPLSLKVSFDGNTRFINLGVDYSKREYDLIFRQTPTGVLLQHRNKANEILNKALKINELLYPFEFNRFKELLKRDETDKRQKTLFIEDLFNEYIEKKKKIGRISTANSYKVAMQSLLRFKKPLLITDITPEFLNDYERWMLKNNDGELTGTLGLYLRSLRTIINNAIQTGQAPKDYQYPFTKHLYTIPVKRKVKKALQRHEIETIANLTEFKSKTEETARDLWLLLFYCNGINWKDLILLRWDDRVDNCFVITREKTKLTSRANPRPIRIPIIPRLQSLLDKIGKKDSLYVLGMVRDDMSEQTIMNKKRKVAKIVNKHLKEIGGRLGLSVDLLTKTARDAYATSLKKKGARIEMIAEQMGHSNTSVTQHYLDSFDDEYLMELNELLP
jgi:integrase